MSIVAEFNIRSPELTLAETFDRVADARYDLVTEVATDPDRPVLFFWVETADFDAFEAAMAADPTVGGWACYTRAGDRQLYRVQLTDETGVVLYPMWVELGVDLLHVRYTDGWWRFRARFPDRDALSTMRDWFGERDVEFRLRSVLDAVDREAHSPLTPTQAETIRLAQRRGYFEVPRETTLAELATELGVSSQAVSERLRRGLGVLVSDHFDTMTPD